MSAGYKREKVFLSFWFHGRRLATSNQSRTCWTRHWVGRRKNSKVSIAWSFVRNSVLELTLCPESFYVRDWKNDRFWWRRRRKARKILQKCVSASIFEVQENNWFSCSRWSICAKSQLKTTNFQYWSWTTSFWKWITSSLCRIGATSFK